MRVSLAGVNWNRVMALSTSHQAAVSGEYTGLAFAPPPRRILLTLTAGLDGTELIGVARGVPANPLAPPIAGLRPATDLPGEANLPA